MDHCDNAKVIITLLDYTSLALFSLSPAHITNTHLRKYRESHTQRHTEHFPQMSRLPGVVLGG